MIHPRRRRRAALGSALLAVALLTACGGEEAEPMPSVDISDLPPEDADDRTGAAEVTGGGQTGGDQTGGADPTADVTVGPTVGTSSVVLLPDGLEGIDDDHHDEVVRRVTEAAGEPDSTATFQCEGTEYSNLTWGDLEYSHPEAAADEDDEDDAFWTLAPTAGEAPPTLPDGVELAGGLDPAMTRGEIIETLDVDDDDLIEEGGHLIQVAAPGTDDEYLVRTVGAEADSAVERIGPYEPCA